MISVHIRKELHSFHGDFSLAADFDSSARHMVLFGASGSGKTLTLQSIAGLINPDSGHISIDGDVLYDSAKRICRPARTRHVGYLLQDYALFPHLSALGNVGFSLSGPFGHLSAAGRARAHELLARFEVDHLSDRLPSEMSGGQKQRVALAREGGVADRTNCFTGKISGINRGDVESSAVVDISDGTALCSILPTEELDELGLAEGDQASVFFSPFSAVLTLPEE